MAMFYAIMDVLVYQWHGFNETLRKHRNLMFGRCRSRELYRSERMIQCVARRFAKGLEHCKLLIRQSLE
jgi:hypothetical protein